MSLLVGCGNGKSTVPQEIKKDISYYHGVWFAEGYGYLLEIQDSGIRVFDKVSSTCLMNQDVTEALPEYFTKLNQDSFVMSYGESSTRYIFTRLQGEISEHCKTSVMDSKSATFEYFVQTMQHYYAYFDLYGVNWSERVGNAKSKVSDEMTDETLFELFTSMLEGINDAHLFLAAEIDGQEQLFSPGRSRILRGKLDEAFSKQQTIDEARAFRRDWFRQHKENIVAKVLTQQKHTDYDDQVLWGKIGNIGYINVLGMRLFAKNEMIDDEILHAKKAFTEVFNELKDTKALIIDVTTNSGGHEEISLLLAGYFTDKKIEVYSKQVKGVSESKQYMTVTPNHEVYRGNVYLVTSDHTVSAAENFVMAMKVLPQVIHVGDTTRGAFSDVLDKELPNGWQIGLSNEEYFDLKGQNHEGKGLVPEVQIGIFSRADIFESHASALQDIIQFVHSKEGFD